MTDALLQSKGLPSAAIQLINDGALKPQAGLLSEARPKKLAVSLETGEPVSPAPVASKIDADQVADRTKVEDEPKPAKSKVKKTPQLKPVGLVSVYVRLPTEIHLAVIKAATDRKLNQQVSASQQAIMTEALTEWLQRNDLLD